MYVYIQTDEITKDRKRLWIVGFYDPAGVYIIESKHDTPEAAAARVNYLNGSESGP